MEYNSFLLRVSCFTFNHAPYIKAAMDGFCMQKTSFPFVCTIVDDASNDGEQDVIKNYLQLNFDLEDRTVVRKEETNDYLLTFAQHKVNKNCFFVVLFLKYNHQSIKKSKIPYLMNWRNTKYFAICEGDDYWTNPVKLQKQVDFLESNPQYTFCVHNFKRYIEKEAKYIEGYKYKKDFSFDIKEYLKYWPTQPLTSMVRTCAEPSVETVRQYKHYRDNHMFYLLLQQGLGYYMADVMGVYRITNKGMWTSLNWIEKIKIDLDCYVELFENNKKDKVLRKHCINSYGYYLYCCKLYHFIPQDSNMNVFGLFGIMMIYFRLVSYYFYGFLKPSIKPKN